MAVFVWLTIILVILIVIIAFLQQEKKQEQIQNGILPKKIPGLEPSDPEEGNISDIRHCNTMSRFLRTLHTQFGPIASFWEGRQFCVSVASPEYLTPQRHLSDLPDTINETIRILTRDDSICVLNGKEAKRRRQIYDQYFNIKALDFYSNIIQEIAQEYVNKWKHLEHDDCIPITRNILQASIKAILTTCFGNDFKIDDNVLKIQQKFDWVINHLENPCLPGTIEETTMHEYTKDIHEIVNRFITDREKNNIEEVEKTLFADVLIRDDTNDSQRVCDGVTFIYTGYETVGRLLVWAIYEACLHEEIQDKIYNEIKTILSEDEPVTYSNMSKFIYLRQVINELMRIRSSAEYTGRKNDEELQLGEYTIPKNTHIYHALAVMAKDDDYWPDAEKFIPERFDSEKSKNHVPLLFKPFGFAGIRHCPGQKFALCELTIFLAEWFRNFKFSLVPGQNYEFNSIIQKIDEEVWVKVTRRNK